MAASATLPNIGEIASFLKANKAHTFDDSYRPVRLKTSHAIGQGYVGEARSNQFQFRVALDRNVPDTIHRFSKRSLCSFSVTGTTTRKSWQTWWQWNTEPSVPEASPTRTRQLAPQDFKIVCFFHGIAYHQAGLEVDHRHVEKLSMDGKIRVFCVTATLAMGVNLPAHLVVIEGAKCRQGGMCRLPRP